MTPDGLRELVRNIVERSQHLRDQFTDEHNAPVNYAAVFAQDKAEFENLFQGATSLGKVLEDTPTGPLFQIDPLETTAGQLQLLKIRRPDPKRPERGDADFTVRDYETFKAKNLMRPGFTFIQREKFEMIELADSRYDVLAYFSHPPVDEQYGLK